MLLEISTTHTPATDLGYLLEKHPARVAGYELAGSRFLHKAVLRDLPTTRGELRVAPLAADAASSVEALYRSSAGKPNRIVLSQRLPRNEDSPSGVFTMTDIHPDLGLNEYYADVVQDVRTVLPGFFDEVLPRTGIGLTGPFYYADLLSDYSEPNPYMTTFERGGLPPTQISNAPVPQPPSDRSSTRGRSASLRADIWYTSASPPDIRKWWQSAPTRCRLANPTVRQCIWGQ